MELDDTFAEGFTGYTSDEIRRMKGVIRLSLLAGFFMLAIKLLAYFITHSTAILSDAAESVVHVVAVAFATYSLRLSTKPADRSHTYGHDRIAFFSAGFEGTMIIIAAIYILYESIHQWVGGLQLRSLDAGTLFTALATVVNACLGWYIVHNGRKHRSLLLVANGKHVLTDSWTSLGVIIGLVLIMITGWLPFDPILAIFVATNILWTGGKLIRQSVGGLMDESDPELDRTLRTILREETAKFNIGYHGLRHRNSGNRVLVEFHLLFPDNIPIAQAHEQATVIEHDMRKAFPGQLEVISHLEPLTDHDQVHQKIRVNQ